MPTQVTTLPPPPLFVFWDEFVPTCGEPCQTLAPGTSTVPGSLTLRRGHRNPPHSVCATASGGGRQGTLVAGGPTALTPWGPGGSASANLRPLEGGGLWGLGAWAGGSPSSGTLHYRSTQLPFILQAEHTQAGGGALEMLLLQ